MKSNIKYGVLHVNDASANSTSPTMRIARFTANELQCPLIHDVASAKQYERTTFDVLFVKYGMLKFSEHRDQALQIHENAKFVVNMENDYTFVPDKRFKKPNETWSTVEKRTRYVNWNVLTRLPLSSWVEKPNLINPINPGLIYYGALREGRVPYFKKFFDDAPYPVTVSSFKGSKRFAALCRGVNVVGAFREPTAPARWEMTIYVEDVASHDLYCSPANRFYECLQMGLPQVIEEKAASTLRAAGFNVDDYVVHSTKMVKAMLKRRDEVIKEQRRRWWRNFGAELQLQFQETVREAFGK